MDFIKILDMRSFFANVILNHLNATRNEIHGINFIDGS